MLFLGACSDGSDSTQKDAEVTPASDCMWVGPWSLDNEEQDLNYSFLDEGATYWISVYTVPEGAHITFEGDFPYSRYMSLSS